MTSTSEDELSCSLYTRTYCWSIPLTASGALQLTRTTSSDTCEVLTPETGPGTAQVNARTSQHQYTGHAKVVHQVCGNSQPSSVEALAKALKGPEPFTLAAATLQE